MAGYWAALGQGASTAAAGGLFSGLGLIGQNRRNRKLIEQQLEAQKQLTDYSGDVNYRYGEMSAENAHERTKELWAMDQAANSYQGQVADAKEAGLSVGLLYGGGGAGGAGGGSTRGAQGDGAGVGTPQAPDFLEIEALKTQKRLAFAEIAKASAEASLTKAERDKTEAETENIKDQTETSKELTPIQKRILEEEATNKLIDNIRKDWENIGGKDVNGNDVDSLEFNDETLKRIIRINKGSVFTEKASKELAQIVGNVELTNKKVENYMQELLNATAIADAATIQAYAAKLAAEFNTGEFSNWKTWEGLAENILKILIGIIK